MDYLQSEKRRNLIAWFTQCTISPDHDDLLRRLAQSDDAELRAAAISSVGRGKRLRREKWAIDLVIEALRPSNPPLVRIQAANVISRLNLKKHLSGYADDELLEVREVANKCR